MWNDKLLRKEQMEEEKKGVVECGRWGVKKGVKEEIHNVPEDSGRKKQFLKHTLMQRGASSLL